MHIFHMWRVLGANSKLFVLLFVPAWICSIGIVNMPIRMADGLVTRNSGHPGLRHKIDIAMDNLEIISLLGSIPVALVLDAVVLAVVVKLKARYEQTPEP